MSYCKNIQEQWQLLLTQYGLDTLKVCVGHSYFLVNEMNDCLLVIANQDSNEKYNKIQTLNYKIWKVNTFQKQYYFLSWKNSPCNYSCYL